MFQHRNTKRMAVACWFSMPVAAAIWFGCWLSVLSGCGGGSSTSPTAPKEVEAGAAEPSKSRGLPSSSHIPDGRSFKNLEAAGVKLVANAKSGNFETADLSQVVATDELAQELGSIDSLTQLVLRQSQLSEDGWKQLSKLAKLQHLDLRECPIDDASLSTLTKSMRNLRSVRLSGKTGNCQVTDAGLEFLSGLEQLKVLALDGVKVGSTTTNRLISCKALSELYLAGTLIDDQSLGVLSGLLELKKLRIAQTGISGAGLSGLSNLPLEELDVSECPKIDDAAATVIAKLTSLKRLNLWSTSVGDSAATAIAQLTRLQWLNLDNTKITDAALLNLKDMKELGFLHLGSTSVSDVGLPALQSMTSLKKLIVTRTQVTQAGVDALQKVMPAVDIQLQYVAGQ